MMRRYSRAEVRDALAETAHHVYTPHAQIVLAEEVLVMRARAELSAGALGRTAAERIGGLVARVRSRLVDRRRRAAAAQRARQAREDTLSLWRRTHCVDEASGRCTLCGAMGVSDAEPCVGATARSS